MLPHPGSKDGAPGRLRAPFCRVRMLSVTAPWLMWIASIFWNLQEHRARALWRLIALAALLVGFGLLIAASGLLPGGTSEASFLVRAGVQVASVTGAVWLTTRFADRTRFRTLGFAMDRAWFADLGFGLGLGAAMITGIFAIERALGWVAVTGTFQTSDPGRAFAGAIWTPIGLFVGVGYVEELLFRGYLLRNLAQGLGYARLGGNRGGLVLACVLSSGLFAVAHVGNPNASTVSTLNIGVAGVFLALGYLLTGQLAMPIGLHVTWNLFQGSVFGFPVSGIEVLGTTFVAIEQRGPDLWTGGVFGPEGGLLGLLAMGAGSALICLWVRGRHGRLRLVVTLVRPPRDARRGLHDAPSAPPSPRTLVAPDGSGESS
jgi:CAAX protease family protein